MVKIKNKFQKKKRIRHEFKIIGIALVIIAALLFIKLLDARTTGFNIYTINPFADANTTGLVNSSEQLANESAGPEAFIAEPQINQNSASIDNTPAYQQSSFGLEGYSISETVYPTIQFEAPTPANNTATTNASQEINISITEANLDDLTWNWNGTNYTMYNDSLVLMMNLDNDNEIGENTTYAVDVSKYGNNATIISSSWTTSGKYGSALRFDNVGSILNISNPENLDISSGDFTISFWYNISGTLQGYASIGQHDKPNGSYASMVDHSWSIQFYANITYYYSTLNGAGVGNGPRLNITTQIDDGRWHQVIVTRNSTNIEIYNDGVFQQRVPSATNLWNSTSPLYIGIEPITYDNIIIYRNYMNKAAITQLYYSNLYKYDIDKWAFYTNQSTDGINHTYFASSQDASGNANKTDVRQVLYGAADIPPSNTGPNITINQPINNTNYTIDTFLINATLIDAESDLLTTRIYAGNESDGANKLVFYNTTNVNDYNFTYNLTSLPLSPSPDDGMVLLMHFDNLTNDGENGTYAVDSSGNGNNGIFRNGTANANNMWTTAGKFASAGTFDGKDDYVLVPSIQKANATNYTYSVWINKKSSTSEDYFMGTLDSVGSFTMSGTNYRFRGQSNPYTYFTLLTETPTLNQWYNLVYVFTDSNTIYFYVNGVYRTSTLITSSTALNFRQIGNGYGTPPNPVIPLNGSIDEVAIWNRSLSAEEIQNIYKLKAGRYYLKVNTTDGALINETDVRQINIDTAPSISDIQYFNGTYADASNSNITKVYRGQRLDIRSIINDNEGNITLNNSITAMYQLPNNTWVEYTGSIQYTANTWFNYSITIPNTWPLGYMNFTINATDGLNWNRREEYSTVQILNNPPTLNSISNQNINEDNDLYFDISAYASDVEDAQFTYQYTNNNTGLIAIAIANSTGNLSANPAANQFGAAAITATAVDTDNGLSSARSFEIIIASVNDAPTLNALPNQNMNEDTNLYLNVSAYANDTEDALSQIKYQYTNNNTNMLNMTLDNSTGNLTAYPAANQFGAAAITLQAFDVQSASSAARSFEIIIANVNDAPNITLISPSNGTYINSNSIFLNVTVDDIDRDSLTVDFIVNTSAVNETFSNITGFNKLNYTAALNDGFHNWTANVTDGSLTNQSEIRFFTIDTVIPVITYNTSTFANNTYTNASSIIVNASIAEQYMDNLTFELFTSSAVANKTVMANDNNNNYTITFSIAADNLYFYNASMYDRADNYNTTDARAITIDRIIPVTVYNTSTPANNSYADQNYIFVNISLVEANLANMTFRLYNQTALLNATIYTGNNRSINWSIENQNAVYKYNITIYDLAGNINQTDTRTITLDNTTPAVSITNPSNGTSYATGSTVTINYTITEANFDKCWYQLGNLTNVTLDCDGVGINNQTAIKGWNNITMFANDSAGHENKSAVISFLIDTVPNIPTLIMPENNTQKLFSNITFLFSSNDSDGDAFTYNIMIANDSAFAYVIDDKYASANTSYNNFSLPQGILYYRIRANDSVAYSNYSGINSFEFVNATLNIYSPSNNTVIYPAQTIAIYVNETARYDWTTNVTLTITGDGVNEDYKPVNLSSGQNMSWNYNYTVPSSLGPSIITIVARAYNGTSENINSSLDLIVTRSVGSAVGSPSIIYFTTDPTYALQSSSVNISLYISTDTVLSAINTSIELPNNTNIDISHMGYSKNNLNYSYNYTYNATDIGNYTITTLITDANNQQATASRSFYTSSNVTIATSLTGINNAAIKDVSSKKVLLSGASINEGLPRGKYDIEFNVNNKPTVTLENASINESFTLSFNYTNLDESTGPSGYRTLDRFQLDNNLEFTRANISYNYSSILSSITTESNLEFHKCSNPDSCTWVQVAAAIDSDNDTITGLFSNFSSFALAERAASTTSTSTVYGSGGGSGGGASNTKFYDLNIIVPAPVSFGLNSKAIVPVSIKNNGQIGLSNVKLTIIPNSTDLKAYSNLNNIPYLDVNREITTDITIETANTSGSYSIAVKAESSNPNFVEVSYIYINSGISTISSNKTIIIEKIKFVKDLFKENPECLELNEIVLQAEDAIKENKIEKAVALTETAINACKDLVTSKGKVIRYPVKVSDNKYIIIASIISASLVAIIWFIYSRIKNKKKSSNNQRKIFRTIRKR